MNKTEKVLDSLRQKPQISISKNFILPNNSGDHQKSIKRNDPINEEDLVNKKYVDDNAGMWETDGTETQLKVADEIDMQSKKIINLTDPASNQDAATKKYVDDADLTSTQKTDLTDSGASTLHYHTADRDRANHTGVEVLPAGTATAGTAPLKFTSGTNLTAAELGAIEFNGTNFYATVNITSAATEDTVNGNANPTNGVTSITTTATIHTSNCYVKQITVNSYIDAGTGTLTANIKAGANVIATKNMSVGTGWVVRTFDFVVGDYSRMFNDETMTIELTITGTIPYIDVKHNVSMDAVNVDIDDESVPKTITFYSYGATTPTRKKITLESV